MIESRFLGRDIRDVGEVGADAFLPCHALLDEPDRQAQHPVHGGHPFGVAARQVVVERQDMHALPEQCVQRRRHHRGKRLPLAGLHFDDVARVEGDRGEHLDVERPQPEDPVRGLANQREEFGANRLEGSAGPLAQVACACFDVAVGQPLDVGAEPLDFSQRLVVGGKVEGDRRTLKAGEALTPSNPVPQKTMSAVGSLHDSLLLHVGLADQKAPQMRQTLRRAWREVRGRERATAVRAAGDGSASGCDARP